MGIIVWEYLASGESTVIFVTNIVILVSIAISIYLSYHDNDENCD